MIQPGIQAGLRLLQRVIQFAPESNLLKLPQNGFVDAGLDVASPQEGRSMSRMLHSRARGLSFRRDKQLDDALIWAKCPYSGEQNVAAL
jgi:hypothetical protein